MSHWDEIVDGFLSSQRWIMTTDALAAYTDGISLFAEKGWPKPFIVAGSRGTGPQPDPAHAEIAVLDLDPGETETPMLTGIRTFEAALRDLPADVIARIRAWDPAGEAKVLASFLDHEFVLDGRPTVGARPHAWTLLEDKLTVDALWDAAGVARAPSQIVPIETGALRAASGRLDRGAGTVWACDSSEGWNGGGEFLRWVRTEAEAADAEAFMARHGSQVRVMPFLDGVPTSIHGMVFPDHVVAFRPIELLTLRQTGTNRLRYAGTASTWDPPAADRDSMRAAARSVGDHLRAAHGYRGVFTIDGVLTADGFLPTELNPRFGAGLFPVAMGSGIPLVGLHRMLISGHGADYRPAELEAAAVAGGDEHRVLRGIFAIDGHRTETEELPVRLESGRIKRASLDEREGAISLGPAGAGSILLIRFDGEHTPSGVQAAPIIVSALELARSHWGIDIPGLEPAPQLR